MASEENTWRREAIHFRMFGSLNSSLSEGGRERGKKGGMEERKREGGKESGKEGKRERGKERKERKGREGERGKKSYIEPPDSVCLPIR